MARVLVVGSRSTDQDRAVLEQLRAWATEAGHHPILPPASTDKPLAALRTALESTDACLALVEGSPIDATTAWTLALAYASRRPILGLRSDVRDDVPAEIRTCFQDF